MTTSTSVSPPQPTGPQLQDHEVLGRDDVPMKIRGRLLGFASSQTDEHQFHPGDFARPGSRCSACRWFECRIFEVDTEYTPTSDVEPPRARYLVLTYGLSDVPGEVDKRRASWTDSPFEIIELLTQRGREDRQAFLPAASARAVAQAANWSEEIQRAYVDRAVV